MRCQKEEQGLESKSGWREVCQVWYVRLMRVHALYLGVGWIHWRKEEPVDGMPGPETIANSTIGGCFKAKMTFPPNYPLYPPKMKFETPIFHPNGKPTGPRSTFQRLTSR